MSDGVTISGTISGIEESVTLSLNGSSETFSSSKFTFSDKLDEGEGYVVSFISATADINCSVIKGTGIAETDISSVVVSCTPNSLSDYLCSSQTATHVNLIGNNLYEFVADEEACFGTTEDFSLLKREVSLELNNSETNSEYLSISITGKLASKEVPSSDGEVTKLYFSFDVTNTSSLALCINFQNRNGALLREGNNTIGEFSLEILGDMFYAENKYRNNCIPTGETRMAWAEVVPSLIAKQENVDNILIQPDVIELFPVNDDQFFLPALTPESGVWASSVKELAGNDSYSYEITTGFINDTPDPVQLRYETADLLFLDENGYLIEQVSASVADYLEKDTKDLVDADLTLDESGGTIKLLNEYSNITPAFGATAQILGRANRAVVHLNICSPDACTTTN